MSYKFVISKPGYNALTETNPDNLIFSSDYNTLKYYVNGSFAIDLNSGTEIEYSLEHGLGYKPVFFAYLQWTDYDPNYFLNFSWADYIYYIHIHAFVDDNYLRIKVRQDQTRDLPGTIRYKIFKNNLGL